MSLCTDIPKELSQQPLRPESERDKRAARGFDRAEVESLGAAAPKHKEPRRANKKSRLHGECQQLPRYAGANNVVRLIDYRLLVGNVRRYDSRETCRFVYCRL